MKKANERISVIITAYNEEKTIERAIQSIHNQTYDNIELIVVNDGSTDTTKTIIDKCLLQEKFKIVYNRRPTGLMAARNIGVANSSGSYIAFLDGDDEWDTRKAEIQLGYLKKINDKSIIFTARVIYQVNGAPCIYNKQSISDQLFFVSYNQVLQKNHKFILGPSMMFKRSTFNMLGGFDEKTGKERDFIARIGVSGGQIAWLGKPLYIQHRKEGSMSTDHEKTYQRELSMIECWAQSKERHWTRNISNDEVKKYRETMLLRYQKQFKLSKIKLVNKNIKTDYFNKLKIYFYSLLKPYHQLITEIGARNRYKKYAKLDAGL